MSRAAGAALLALVAAALALGWQAWRPQEPSLAPTFSLDELWGNARNNGNGDVSGNEPDPFAALRALGVVRRTIPRVEYRALDRCRTLPLADCFFNRLAANLAPVVVTGSPVREWPAFGRWSPAHVAAAVRTEHLDAVRVSRTGPVFRYYNDLRANVSFQHVAAVVAAYGPTTYRHESVPKTAFFDALARDTREPGEPFMYWGDSLGLLSEQLAREAGPSDFLIVRNATFEPTRAALFRKTQAWIGRARTVTPLHYDAAYNFHVGIVGVKRVLLFAPSDWASLYLFPHLHPGVKQSQVDLAAPDLRAHPRVARAVAHETELRPGEVLYIPPFWGHTFVTTSPAVLSLNVWTTGLESLLSSLLAVPMPGLPRVALDAPASALFARLYVRTLAETVMDAAAAVVAHAAAAVRRDESAARDENGFPRADAPAPADGSAQAVLDDLVDGQYGPVRDQLRHPNATITRVTRSYCEATLSRMSASVCERVWWRPDSSPDACRASAPDAAGLAADTRAGMTQLAESVRAILARQVPGGLGNVAVVRLVLSSYIESLALTAVNDDLYDVADFLHDLAKC